MPQASRLRPVPESAFIRATFAIPLPAVARWKAQAKRMTAIRVFAYATAAFLVVAVIAGTTILVHQPSRLERWYRAGLDQPKKGSRFDQGCRPAAMGRDACHDRTVETRARPAASRLRGQSRSIYPRSLGSTTAFGGSRQSMDSAWLNQLSRRGIVAIAYPQCYHPGVTDQPSSCLRALISVVA